MGQARDGSRLRRDTGAGRCGRCRSQTRFFESRCRMIGVAIDARCEKFLEDDFERRLKNSLAKIAPRKKSGNI
jgi:hypothetical protein